VALQGMVIWRCLADQIYKVNSNFKIMKKKVKKPPPKDEIVKADLPFEELMKKALNTPLPKKEKKAKKK
jgi:hypothetical protein